MSGSGDEDEVNAQIRSFGPKTKALFETLMEGDDYLGTFLEVVTEIREDVRRRAWLVRPVNPFAEGSPRWQGFERGLNAAMAALEEIVHVRPLPGEQMRTTIKGVIEESHQEGGVRVIDKVRVESIAIEEVP